MGYRLKIQQEPGRGGTHVNICEKAINEVDYANVREIFIRSESGCVCLLPIETRGYLACMSTPKINSTKLQLLTLRTINRVIRYL